MLLVPLEIQATFGIVEQTKSDIRGTLTRIWDRNSQMSEFKLTQSSVVTNPTSGTLRGLHYQDDPFSENKVVQCVSGRVFDVIVDLRKDSRTRGMHVSYEIGPQCEYLGLVIPSGCAHGYLTLESNSTLVYFMDQEYSADHARGLRWNDPQFSIMWPRSPLLISERDANWSEFIL